MRSRIETFWANSETVSAASDADDPLNTDIYCPPLYLSLSLSDWFFLLLIYTFFVVVKIVLDKMEAPLTPSRQQHAYSFRNTPTRKQGGGAYEL